MTASTRSLETARERFFTSNSAPKPSTPEEQAAHDTKRLQVDRINDALVNLAAVIDENTPQSRNKSLAMTALEEVSMRANRAIFATGPTA